MGMAIERAEADTDFVHKASGYRIAGEEVDGMDVVAVESAARQAVEMIRAGERSLFSGMPHLPLSCAFDVRCATLSLRRKKSRPGERKARSFAFRDGSRANHLIRPEEVQAIETKVEAEIAAAVAFAEAGALESVAEVERFVTMTEIPS